MVIQGLVINRCLTAAIQVGSGGDGTYIIGNFIGTDPTGNTQPALQNLGVDIASAPGVVVGGTTPFERNLAAGSIIDVRVGAGGDGAVVRGNLIGTNAAGTAAVSQVGNNFGAGISVSGAANVTIGGATVADRNVISGAGLIGIDASGVTIQGNYIGTDVTGTQALGNLYGISSAGSLIKGNVIAANAEGIAASDSIIQGNFIGTDETGTLDLGNSRPGSPGLQRGRLHDRRCSAG